MRLNVIGGASEEEKYDAWRNPSVKRWLESVPVELERIRLDRYFYLTRENLKNQTSIYRHYLWRQKKYCSGLEMLLVA